MTPVLHVDSLTALPGYRPGRSQLAVGLVVGALDGDAPANDGEGAAFAVLSAVTSCLAGAKIGAVSLCDRMSRRRV